MIVSNNERLIKETKPLIGKKKKVKKFMKTVNPAKNKNMLL